MIEGRAELSGDLTVDARGHAIDDKAERLQQLGKEAVQFVAEAAMTARDDLFEEIVDVERERPPEMNVQILERHAQQMCMMQAVETGQIVLGRLGDAQAL